MCHSSLLAVFLYTLVVLFFSFPCRFFSFLSLPLRNFLEALIASRLRSFVWQFLFCSSVRQFLFCEPNNYALRSRRETTNFYKHCKIRNFIVVQYNKNNKNTKCTQNTIVSVIIISVTTITILISYNTIS